MRTPDTPTISLFKQQLAWHPQINALFVYHPLYGMVIVYGIASTAEEFDSLGDKRRRWDCYWDFDRNQTECLVAYQVTSDNGLTTPIDLPANSY